MEDEILSLVLDGVQVVSYKWLSRKFSISSNEAKRLLQIIADQHGSRIEVVYVVSGWSKTNKNFYSVQLVPKSKLHEATDVLDGHISVHVYSIQPAIPKDPAELWAAEYAQAHELFEQDPKLSNCLRDNRFSAVTCTSISCKRLGDSGSSQKDVSKSPFKSSALSKNLVKQEELHTTVGISKSTEKQDNSKSTEKHNSKPTSHEENDSKVPEKHASVHECSINISESKETTTKKGSGGGIANLWGRASTKTKPVAPRAHVESAAKIEVQEETKAQAQAHDVSLGESSEDDASDFMHVRRGQPKQNNGRTRRMVLDDEMSDDGEDNAQHVISLSSPDVPSKKKPCSVSDKETQGTNTLKEKRKKRIDDTRSSPEIDPPSLHEDGKQARDASLDTIDKESHTESNVEDERVPIVKSSENDAKAEQILGPQLITNNGALQSVKKRRKVLKTHIDDHGREVTEVVWENDTDGANSEDKVDGAVNTNAHRDASSKVPDNKTFGNKDPQKPLSSKTLSSNPKAAKGATSKDPQQGKISSFFKKKN